MVLAPEHPLVDELTAASWPPDLADDVRAAWTGGHATPAEAVAAYRRQAGARSDIERQTEGRDKTGVFVGGYAINPATGDRIPVFVADYVLMGYGTGAIMAVPAQDERDWEFAEAFGLPIVRTVQPPDGWQGEAFAGEGPAINSANAEVDLNGLGIAEAKRRIIDWLEATGAGTGTVTTRLRDWLFSRQRFWGEPFPIVYDPDDGLPRAVPDSMLPVVLPHVEDYSPATFADDDETSVPVPPLARATDWVEVSSTWARAPRSTAARPTPCRSGPGRAGTSCVTSTPPTSRPSSTPRSSATGWARGSRATPAASTCTSAAPSTPCCTCCTPGSGTRCCSTWATCRRSSRTGGCSTRA